MDTIRRAASDADWRDATALLHDHVEWMRNWTGFDPLAEQPALLGELEGLADRYGDDDAAVFLAHWDQVAVGTAAVRCHPDGDAELKRMYIRPVARGCGIADRLIEAVVDLATGRGCRSVWLETVRGAMDAAITVYRRNGFVEAPARAATLSMAGVVVMERPTRSAARCA